MTRNIDPCFWHEEFPENLPVTHQVAFTGQSQWYVECGQCTASSPLYATEDEAILEWNRMGTMVRSGALLTNLVGALIEKDADRIYTLSQQYHAMMSRPEVTSDDE